MSIAGGKLLVSMVHAIQTPDRQREVHTVNRCIVYWFQTSQ